MNSRGLDLTEEAVGFGLPVLKQGLADHFSGKGLKLDLFTEDLTWVVTAIYSMNLVEKIGRPGTASLKSRFLYAAKNTLAAFIRSFPLTAASPDGSLQRLTQTVSVGKQPTKMRDSVMKSGWYIRSMSGRVILSVEAEPASHPWNP